MVVHTRVYSVCSNKENARGRGKVGEMNGNFGMMLIRREGREGLDHCQVVSESSEDRLGVTTIGSLGKFGRKPHTISNGLACQLSLET